MIVQALVIAAVVAATAALVAAELGGRRAVAGGAKVVASAGFVLLAVVRADLASRYDVWLLAALALCLVGDVLLILPRALPAGLAAFLLANLGYVFAFSTLVAPRAWPPLLAVVLALAGGIATAWLWPHLGKLRAAVIAYIAVISAMTWGAVAVAGRAGWTVAVAGVLFYGSDLTVARDRFVVRRFASRAWGLPAYYLAQVLFALSVGRGLPRLP